MSMNSMLGRRARLGAQAAPLALLAAACSSGLDNFTAPPAPADPEPLSTGVDTFGLTTGAGAALGSQAVTGAVIAGAPSYVLAAFTSSADGTTIDADLSADANGANDVFLQLFSSDGMLLESVVVSQVSVGGSTGNGASSDPAITFVPNAAFDPTDVTPATGDEVGGTVFVAYTSASSDIAGTDGNGADDVFRAAFEVVYDPLGTTDAIDTDSVQLRLSAVAPPQLVSQVDGSGTSGSGASSSASISPDGDAIAFLSSDTNLTALADSDSDLDLYLRLVSADRTIAVSTNAAGSALASGGDCGPPVFSRNNARALAFSSEATDHISTDTNGVRDVFYAELDPDNELVSSARLVSQQVGGDIGSGGDSRNPSLWVGEDEDGDPTRVLIAFDSDKTDLVASLPALTSTSVYLFDQTISDGFPQLGTTLLLNQRLNPAGGQPGTAARGPAVVCDTRTAGPAAAAWL